MNGLLDELPEDEAEMYFWRLWDVLRLYVKRRKPRVERMPSDSRKLARQMFVSSRPVAWMRNVALRSYSFEMLAKNIAKAFDEPI
ncbi:MAG: hypothetical protein IT180_08535 [Acidobacteria bacterium]|nr:hypothetical protein [Acidobacteriota bacterium]